MYEMKSASICGSVDILVDLQGSRRESVCKDCVKKLKLLILHEPVLTLLQETD